MEMHVQRCLPLHIPAQTCVVSCATGSISGFCMYVTVQGSDQMRVLTGFRSIAGTCADSTRASFGFGLASSSRGSAEPKRCSICHCPVAGCSWLALGGIEI